MPFTRRSFLRGVGAASAAAARLPGWAGRFGVEELQAEPPSPSPRGGNPIVVGKGLCDPQVRIYGDQAYLYATHDAVPGSDKFIMNDWWVWHSSDLVHWKQVSTLRPEDTYWGKPCNQCWATDAMSRNGQYYFYFSRGPEEIGVVRSDTPAGPMERPPGQAADRPGLNAHAGQRSGNPSGKRWNELHCVWLLGLLHREVE